MKINGLTIIFTIVARLNCESPLDSLGEMKMSLQILQDTVDRISLEQIKTNEKVDRLQRTISKVDTSFESLSLGEIKTNEKFDQLQKDMSRVANAVKRLSLDIKSMIGTNIDTLEVIYEANNKTFEAIDQLHNVMKTIKSDCNKVVNVTTDFASVDAENQDRTVSTGNLNKTFNAEEEKVIVVTGGYNKSYITKTVEAISLEGTPLCTLPDLPDERRRHTMDDDIMCGGYSTKTSCLRYVAGEWTRFRRNLVNSRSNHVSWKRPDGEVVLLGGEDSKSTKTSEVVNGSDKQIGFDLKYETYFACAIKLDKFVVITGGRTSQTIVSKYDINGWMMDLRSLNTGRYEHGCGFYYKDINELIYLVTGGRNSAGERILSTEIMSSSLARWSYVGNLPKATNGLAGISINNKIFITGGYNGTHVSDILKFNPDTVLWEKTGEMKNARYNHAVAVLPLKEVKPYCS